MKFCKFYAMFAAASIAVGAFADAANLLVSFSTESDSYADGTPVLDGEWYALCWSADAEFDGLTLDCEPVDADEKVLVLAPLAEGGRCPYVVFQLDSNDAPEGGNYFVYLLDTRDAAGTSPSSAKTSEVTGKRVPASSVNGSAASAGFTASAARGDISSAAAIQGETWAESAIAEGVVKQPVITAFNVANAKVVITVADLLPGVKYNVYMGESPSNFSSYGLTTPTNGVETAQFEIDPGNAKFFKVVRQPLKAE